MLRDDACSMARRRKMAWTRATLCLLIPFVILTKTFLHVQRLWGASETNARLQRKVHVEEVAGEDNAGGGMGSQVLTRFRILLGTRTSSFRRQGNERRQSLSPAPAPAIGAASPAPFPLFKAHVRPTPPFHYQRHIPPVQSLERGSSNSGASKASHRRMVAAAVTSTAAALLIVGVATSLYFKRYRRARKRRPEKPVLQISMKPRFQVPSGAANKVSFDPGGPGPESFCMNSLDSDHGLKQTSKSKNGFSSHSTHSFLSQTEEPLKCLSDSLYCSDTLRSISDKHYLTVENLPSDYDDDESFHSLCCSHSSNRSVLDGSEDKFSLPRSEICSPHSSSYLSISPHHEVSNHPAVSCPFQQKDEDFRQAIPCSPPQLESFQTPYSPNLEELGSLSYSNTSEPIGFPSVKPANNHISGWSSELELEPLTPSFSISLALSPPTTETSADSLKVESECRPPPPPPPPAPPPPPPPPPLTKPVLHIPSMLPAGNRNDNSKSPPPHPHPVLHSPLMPPVGKSNTLKPPPPPPPPPPAKPAKTSGGCKCNSGNLNPPPSCPSQQAMPTGEDGTPLPKLKPLHWDKIRATPHRSMVWDKIRSSSFEFDEEMIESLFSYNLTNSAKPEEMKIKTSSPPNKHVMEHKRLQNITILMKALNATTEQVCGALVQGTGLSVQQLEALVKMVPTQEESEKLSNYEGDIDELDAAEKLIKAILSIPYAFMRSEAMLYRETFEDEVAYLRSSFKMIEEACEELKSSRLFLRLLEAVLKTGNRMNVGTFRGDAKAFKLDALLKLADVKGTDGQTTLLHFVVKEMIRTEGSRAMEIRTSKTPERHKSKTTEEREEDYRVTGLNLVSGLTNELCNVKKSASIDLNVLISSVSNLSSGMAQLKHLLEESSIHNENENFFDSIRSFSSNAEKIIQELIYDENQVLLHVRQITEYYHGNIGKDDGNPLRIFVTVRDFLTMLDRACKEVKTSKSHHGPFPAIPF